MFDTHSFPDDVLEDSEIVEQLGLGQPLDTLTLKAPQQLYLWFAKKSKKHILAFDKGMGKTIAYLLAARQNKPERIVILCTRNAMLAQRREIMRHFPEWADRWAFVRGKPSERAQMWNNPDTLVFITTYATWMSDIGVRAKSVKQVLPSWVSNMAGKGIQVICDEYHKVLRNKGSKMHKALKAANPDYLILSSGSAANKGPQSVWTALNCCDPKLWSSYWKYVHTFCFVSDGPFGKQIEGVRNIQAWRNAVAPYVFRRKKDLKDYPPKTRQLLEVEMEPWQRRIHDQLQKELLVFLRGGETAIVAKNSLDATLKIRQFMLCPKFLDPSLGWGAYLEGTLIDFQDSELTHAVVSLPFVKPIPLIQQFFKEHGIKTWVLQGGISMEDMDERITAWTKSGGIMLQSIHFAESYELPAAHVMYMLGYTFDPEQNSQAEDRIHRDIRVTPHPVDIYYLMDHRAYDRKVMDGLANNADDAWWVMDASRQRLIETFGG